MYVIKDGGRYFDEFKRRVGATYAIFSESLGQATMYKSVQEAEKHLNAKTMPKSAFIAPVKEEEKKFKRVFFILSDSKRIESYYAKLDDEIGEGDFATFEEAKCALIGQLEEKLENAKSLIEPLDK